MVDYFILMFLLGTPFCSHSASSQMSKARATKKAEQSKRKKKISAAKSKSTLACVWAKSIWTEARIIEGEEQGLLPSQKAISWRAPRTETRRHPEEDVVV